MSDRTQCPYCGSGDFETTLVGCPLPALWGHAAMSKRTDFRRFVERLESGPEPVAADLRKVYDGFLSGLDELPVGRLTEDGCVLVAWEGDRYVDMELVGGGLYEVFMQDYKTGEYGGEEDVRIGNLKPIRAALEWSAGPAGVAP